MQLHVNGRDLPQETALRGAARPDTQSWEWTFDPPKTQSAIDSFWLRAWLLLFLSRTRVVQMSMTDFCISNLHFCFSSCLLFFTGLKKTIHTVTVVEITAIKKELLQLLTASSVLDLQVLVGKIEKKMFLIIHLCKASKCRTTGFHKSPRWAFERKHMQNYLPFKATLVYELTEPQAG